ncbi:MAG: hypothetical protein Q7V56_16835 [Gammaproteobacteria bacterium]|nr:hypothetical protein [Gammaproteobacteria bacterium]
MLRISTILTCALLVLAPCTVEADSWVQPEIKTYPSKADGYSFTVEPRLFGSQLFPFKERSTGRADVGADSEYPKGRLVSPSGEVLWERKLVNEVSPVNALVSAGGRYVVTFDNWSSIGYGSDVVVIYGQSGQLIRKLSLGDIVGPRRVSEFPISIGSRWWSGDHQFESEEFLSLSVLAGGSDFFSDEPKFESIRVRLEDGVVVAQ